MSQSTCAKGESITNNGAFARHAKACDVCERGAADPETSENGGFRASDLQMGEIRAAVKRADAATLDATLAKHGHEPAEGDTREDAAAKALIRAKSGGREAYATVFGECPVDGCEYGRNGLHATACKRHEGEREAETGSSEPETSENDTSEPSPEQEGADEQAGEGTLPSEGAIAGKLMSQGISPENSVEMAAFIRDAVREGADVSDAVAAAQAKLA